MNEQKSERAAGASAPDCWVCGGAVPAGKHPQWWSYKDGWKDFCSSACANEKLCGRIAKSLGVTYTPNNSITGGVAVP
jgi:hypothetical protein